MDLFSWKTLISLSIKYQRDRIDYQPDGGNAPRVGRGLEM